MPMILPIIYQDEYLIAINKPSGLLVHRSMIDKHETIFAVQLLRQQLGQKVYPVHRLDKPTSGVLLFALNTEIIKALSAQWQNIHKSYWAITRGRLNSTTLNHPITTKPDKGDTFHTPKVQTAETQFRHLASATLPVSFGKQAAQFNSTTFSWVEAVPTTGRKHQIRKHLKHLSHPIVGDTRYGRGEINRYFRDYYAVNRLMLHCRSMVLSHPVTDKKLTMTAAVDSDWETLLRPFQTP